MLLPAPDGPTIASFLAAPDGKRHAVEHRHSRARGIGEADIREGNLAARTAPAAAAGRAGATITGRTLRISNSRSAAPEACEISPQTSESWPSAGGGEHRIEHELREPPRAHAAAKHVLGADPQHHHHAGEHEKDAIAVRIARAVMESRAAVKARSTAARKRPRRQRLVGEGLQHAHRADQLGRIGGGVGERVLRRARAPADRAAEAVERQHDHRDGAEHEGGEPRARHHHHGGRADEQDQVAQGDRNRGADRGLDLGGVGGEPRDQLAALGAGRSRPARARRDGRTPRSRRSATMRSPSVVTR